MRQTVSPTDPYIGTRGSHRVTIAFLLEAYFLHRPRLRDRMAPKRLEYLKSKIILPTIGKWTVADHTSSDFAEWAGHLVNGFGSRFATQAVRLVRDALRFGEESKLLPPGCGALADVPIAAPLVGDYSGWLTKMAEDCRSAARKKCEATDLED